MNAIRRPNSSARLKKVLIPCYLEPAQAVALRALSAKTRIPQQTFLREAVDDILTKYRKELRS